MRTGSKIQQCAETIARLIAGGTPGFTDRLPSRRELARRFGLSTASVQLALAELERRGMVRNHPRQCSQVTTGGAPTMVEKIAVAVFETRPHQIRFWLEQFQHFEQQFPGVQLQARFYRNRTDAGPVPGRILIRPPESGQPTPLVPLSEILGPERLARLRARLLPQLTGWNWDFDLPYQLQCFALIYRHEHSLTPRSGETLPDWFRRLSRELGPRSIPPPNADCVAGLSGLQELLATAPERVPDSAALARFVELLTLYARSGIIAPDLPELPESALLTRGELRATLCHTHRWAEYELPQRPELRLAPLPVAAGSADLVYLPCARLAGDDAVTTGERNFFEFLVSTPFQQAMMRSLIGISPYLPELQVAETEIPHLKALLRALQTRALCYRQSNHWPTLCERLIETALLPLLLHRIAPEEALTRSRRTARTLIRPGAGSRESYLKRFWLGGA